MSIHATGTVKGKSWDEQSYSEIDGERKLTRASVTNAFSGDIEGDGTLEYLMTYPGDGSASFIGLERVIGRVGERSGSFVLQHSGTFAGGVAKATWFVVPASATGDLRGLRGEGGYEAGQGQQEVPFTLDYDFG
jgi:hypothetical protein